MRRLSQIKRSCGKNALGCISGEKGHSDLRSLIRLVLTVQKDDGKVQIETGVTGW